MFKPQPQKPIDKQAPVIPISEEDDRTRQTDDAATDFTANELSPADVIIPEVPMDGHTTEGDSGSILRETKKKQPSRLALDMKDLFQVIE